MSRLTGPQRREHRREQREKRKENAGARVVRRGQRAILNGKRVIADGKGNWMPESHYDRYSPNFRKGKPVGTYVVGQDRSKPTTQGETAAQRESRIFPPTRGAKRSTQGRTAETRKRQQEVTRAIEQTGNTGSLRPSSGQSSTRRPSSGQQSTRPRQGGTRPVQAQRPTKPTKPAKDTRTTLQKEIDGAKTFIATYKDRKGAMQNAVKQARERLARLQKKQKAKELKIGNNKS